jgi:hypothetical protein
MLDVRPRLRRPALAHAPFFLLSTLIGLHGRSALSLVAVFSSTFLVFTLSYVVSLGINKSFYLIPDDIRKVHVSKNR